MSRPIISFTTDFGVDSPYVAQMKAAVLRVSPDATFVDITHSIPPQNVRQAALVLAQVVPRFPKDAIHVVVVDPGVGTSRRILLARILNQSLIAPDNGILSGVTRIAPAKPVIAITNDQFWNQPVSTTFHGRDIMAPVAAHLSQGLSWDKIGSPVDDWVKLNWNDLQINSDSIQGSVVLIDSFGNLLTDIPLENIPSGARNHCRISCGVFQTNGITATYGVGQPGELVALTSSSDYLEMAVVNGNAALHVGAKIGDAIQIHWN
jgi:hypothetical protein